jgi:hypothetical protein
MMNVFWLLHYETVIILTATRQFMAAYALDVNWHRSGAYVISGKEALGLLGCWCALLEGNRADSKTVLKEACCIKNRF